MEQFFLDTPKEGFIDITLPVGEIILNGHVRKGICQIFVPHTTAGVTINENADPDVVSDMQMALDAMIPDLPFRHIEGNSAAHLKSSMIGSSITVPIMDHSLVLGTWQAIYFCEFDGPRRRKVWVQVLGV